MKLERKYYLIGLFAIVVVTAGTIALHNVAMRLAHQPTQAAADAVPHPNLRLQ